MVALRILGRFAALAGFSLALAAPPALGAPVTKGTITVSDAWARPTVGSSADSVIYLTIGNAGKADDHLTKVTTPAASMVELHATMMDGGMMKMRAMDAVTIPAGGSVALAPGGDHIMLMGLTKPLHIGDTLDVTLSFEKAGDVDVEVPVLAAAP